MISVKNLRKVYKLGKKKSSKNVVALNNVSIDFPDKGLVFLLGKSGSGKSTLLNVIGGLDTFDEGEIIIKGKSSKDFKQSDFDSYRNTFIGFIFQEYNILEEFTVGKNLALALELQGKKAEKSDVEKLLDEVDLSGYYKRKPNQLSGGQKQRVAIARALIKDPEIIMADEPTGALDSATGKQVMDTLKKLSKNKLVIVVSHDREFAEIYGDRVVELKDGSIIRDEVKKEVEAVKTESGVSFIDNKIIHIKKDQHLTKEDLIQINRMIVENVASNDTIISFDEKSNTEVKKTAFITDEGNREVFKTTTVTDIERKNHDPKDFKMIKSKLKLKDSFKIGASSLKHKPIRLIFTILLSVFAFGMFGIVSTMSSFNRGNSIYSTIEQLNIDTISIAKSSGYSKFPISKKYVDKFKSDNKDYKFYEVVQSGVSYYLPYYQFSNQTGNPDYTLKARRMSGILQWSDTLKNEYNLTFATENSKAPENKNEICISYNMAKTIVSEVEDINSMEELIGKDFGFHSNYSGEYFKITGIVNPNVDTTKYESLTGDSSSMRENQNLYGELEIVINYSLLNMCYVNQESYEMCYENSSNMQNSYLNIYVDEDDFQNGGYGTQFYTVSQYADYHYTISYLKSGVDVNNLKSNQVILDIGLNNGNLGISNDDIIDKIDNGLTVHFSGEYKAKESLFDLEVVGYFNGGGGTVLVSDEFYNNMFKGASYLLTKLQGTNADKKLIKYFEDDKIEKFNYHIQCVATPVLDNFGNFIEEGAKIFIYVGIGLAVFSALMLMNFISISITYKKREIGVLRAIGARGKDVFSIFFAESFVICMINFLISSVACGIICGVINNVIVKDLGISLTLLVFGIPQILLLFGVSLLVAFIACFIPVFKFARKNPIDSINNR